jgi:hypothetical protein
MLVGEQPGNVEDLTGTPFVGAANALRLERSTTPTRTGRCFGHEGRYPGIAASSSINWRIEKGVSPRSGSGK